MTFSLLCHLLGCSRRQKWRMHNVIIFEDDKCLCESVRPGRKVLYRHLYPLCTLRHYESGSQLLVLRSLPFYFSGIGGAWPPPPSSYATEITITITDSSCIDVNQTPDGFNLVRLFGDFFESYSYGKIVVKNVYRRVCVD